MDAPRRSTCLALAILALPAPRAWATPDSMLAAVRAFTGGQPWQEGRVALDIAALVENGNAVPVTVTVTVDATMRGADAVQAIALFTENNPLPEVAVFTLGAAVARPQVATRIRLATSGRVLALARLADGRCWGAFAEVVVTLAACIEG